MLASQLCVFDDKTDFPVERVIGSAIQELNQS